MYDVCVCYLRKIHIVRHVYIRHTSAWRDYCFVFDAGKRIVLYNVVNTTSRLYDLYARVVVFINTPETWLFMNVDNIITPAQNIIGTYYRGCKYLPTFQMSLIFALCTHFVLVLYTSVRGHWFWQYNKII